MSREGEKALEGEWYDPAQRLRAEWLGLNFLTRIENEEPRVLEELHDEVLAAYQGLVNQHQSKDVERLLYSRGHAIAAAAGAPSSKHSWELPSAIFRSLMEASHPVPGLESFRLAFMGWYEKWHLPDAWAHDQAFYLLSDWVFNPQGESRSDDDDDWSLCHEIEKERKENIAEIKKQIAEMAKLKPAGQHERSKSGIVLLVRAIKERYEKELRDLEKELKQYRRDMKKNQEIVKRKRSRASGYRWLPTDTPYA